MAYVKGLLGDMGPQHRLVGKSILEFGSFNVNGAVRDLLPKATALPQPARYVGVDWRQGPGVDHVCLFHDIPWIGEFDILISCNVFEHDPHWERSIEAGLMALKPGGEIILCCAGPGYPAHEVASSPLEGHYSNIPPGRFLEVLVSHGARGAMTVFTEPQDIAFHGSKLSPSDA